ncbi:MAG: hypothetical protein A3G51_01005 [Candidatus Yanofskybacteria bacterium RIFCSPLOWO2_12_FULL_43_11b]|uniref:DUF5671 domain-containing protein n=1 Tax=Candidatus Yanofskybacteria bacterium RIFCSPLOWO2_12_FULL_43_11b TaxID=1802710 RepID=A0A1F8H716_9BACT|nr:MAG: hypothetical protein A2742_02490 [Candidatus Yanofskybacteria bacterium RIFCSPHIGHO2_01_FULL_43_32]OGN11560.1 MAG: hypothetical protein A3C69_03830 [Candidatus Yanofskybacteria bacterium RIFCSPHIGHO2_02_FULL_43_12]OGN17398.1 MAG: hypothetical protein A3E34_00960 [Candidatus Yanofskybacteria bacterium RIFCSPHIGHO2_12_FULL_43_11]OGN24897.1 MAG: hypothetical protein A2923_01310 [Candidatus Yanofskybacteria bacterium RIFCSPLOWO2_01_FULL_43_46]OGN33377.1 MAG: hypothetical protein A3G51_01005
MSDQINKNLPRDVFLYLLSIITLVASTISFGVLVFQYINIYFPDIIYDYYVSASSYFSPIRQSLATLIVIFPVYFFVLRFLAKDVDENPEKRDLKIRKWLLYFTVFVAALVIIGDLVALINTYLNGELTTRFILKVLTIFFIAGSVFSYYFSELRELRTKGKKSLNWISVYKWVVVAVVILAVGFGFYVAGSPANQRMIRFDERRVNDLSALQNQIINYWQKKNELPQNLSQMANDILGIVIPGDPKTGTPYEYRVLGNLKFELCATFENSNLDQKAAGPKTALREQLIYPYSGGEMQTWQHNAERTCFNRTIDPDLFKVEISKPL